MHHNNHILHTKLHRPLTKDDIVYRPKLFDTLNRNYKKNILTLVSAPAGYGKSSLISFWLEEGAIPNCWISLDGSESDLRSFLEYLVHAVDDIYPGKLVNAALMLKNPVMPPAESITSTILNELDEIEEDFVLVLDDYHHITSREIHAFVDSMLQYPPEKLHLCIISRRDPPLRIGSLRAYNRLCEIRMIDLAFDNSEISVLYKNLLDFQISDEISNKLLENTEGWVTGLRLMAYSVSSPEQLDKLLFQMKGNSLYVTEYLIKEVLSSQPENLRELLMKTSLLDNFCSEMVDILTPPAKGPKKAAVKGKDFLEWLENTNMFLISLDNDHKWYRYHTLFREILLKQLKEKQTQEQLSTFHKRISKWFEDKNLIEEAVKHALDAGDEEFAADIVERNCVQALDKDAWLKLEKWLSLLPSDIIDRRPKLLITMAWIGKIKRNFQTLTVSLNKCEAMLGKHPEKSSLYGEFCSLRGYVRFFVSSNVKEAMEFTKTAMKSVPDNNFGTIRAETEMQYILLMHCAGNSQEAINYALKRLNRINPDKQRLWERLQYGLCIAYLLGADLLRCYNYAKEMRVTTEKNGNLFAGVWSRWFMGAVSFYRFDLEEAKEHFEYVVQNRFLVFDHTVLDSIYALSLTYQMLSEDSKADDALGLLEDYADWTKRLSHSVLVGSLKARLGLLRGNNSEAVIWQRSFNSPILLSTSGFYVSSRSITECAALVSENTQSSLKMAGEKISKIMSVADELNYKGKLIELTVLQSIVFDKQGMEKQSVSAMKKALGIAESFGWVLSFIEYGKDTMGILDKVIKKGAYTTYCKMLKETYQKFQTSLSSKAHSAQTVFENTVEPLTQRESEILTLISFGYKNKEIGEKIFLAPTTIKKHVYNIFQKFGVHSRMELISKAKKLELISK